MKEGCGTKKGKGQILCWFRLITEKTPMGPPSLTSPFDVLIDINTFSSRRNALQRDLGFIPGEF